MKIKKTTLLSTLAIILSLIAITLSLWSVGHQNRKRDTQNVERDSLSDNNPVRSSILELTGTWTKGDLSGKWHSHCCLYGNQKNFSFLAFPTHCFDYDSTKSYSLEVTDYLGRKTKLDLQQTYRSKNLDAEILKVQRIKDVPSLCEQNLTSEKFSAGSSVTILTPFNSREIKKRNGILQEKNRVSIENYANEPGDSGGLIIAKNKVIGIITSATAHGRVTEFVSISCFEDLYAELVTADEADNEMLIK